MKKLLVYITPIFLLISCQKADHINFNKDYIEVDYQTQEIILKTDENIGGIGFILSESDTEGWNEDVDENYWICTGDWFTITLDKSRLRQVVVAIQENKTDKDRKVVIRANRDIGSDTATIVQKAKPME